MSVVSLALGVCVSLCFLRDRCWSKRTISLLRHAIPPHPLPTSFFVCPVLSLLHNVYVSVCVYVCVYVFVYVYLYLYICVYMYVYVCANVGVWICHGS